MSKPARQTASIVLLVAGCLCILAGAFTLYARTQVLSAEKVADKAERTLDHEEVRDAAATQITEDLITRVDPDLVTAKPLLEVGVGALIQSSPFKAAFRQGIENGYDAVINGNDGAVVTIANLGVLIDQAVRQFRPQLAKKIPNGLDSTLVRLGEGGFAVDGAQTVEKLRLLGLILPPLGLLLLAGSLFAATDRRRAVIRAGAGLAGVALFAFVALTVVGEVVQSRIADETNRDAFDPVWESFIGPLYNWYLLIGGFGVVVAAAASSALRTRDLGGPLRWIWDRVSTEPASTHGKVFWALGVGAAGTLMILRPLEVLQLLTVVAGAYVLSIAVATVVAIAEKPMGARASKQERKRIVAWTAGGVAGAVVLAAILVALLTSADDKSPEVADGKGCNGMESLCDRSLDEVSFAATHNSYAGANYPGFLFPEQDNTIPQQLDAGVRGLWIDTYYGVPGRRVYTDTSKVDPALIAQVNEELGPKFAAAGANIRSTIAKPPADAKTEIYLCHGFCELGAVSAEQTFREIAEFLEDNPNEVLIIDLEDYTTPADTQALIEKTGLVDYVYKGKQGPPWPTLEEMIESGGRVLLVSEHMSGGESWYRPLNSTIQETPFEFPPADAASPKLMTCKGGRGDRSTTLFLINHWIGTDPTPKPSNALKINARDFLLDRARRCERQRGRFPNVLNVDFYKQGDVFGVVRELNKTEPKSPEASP